MRTVSRWLGRGAEVVAAALLAAMFLTFCLQILTRYVIPGSFGWTLELCLTLWLWLVFWGAAFVVRDRDHVTFDLGYLAAPRRVRRVMALVSAGAVAVALAWSLLPTWDYIDFMRIKRSSTLEIPLRTVFSIYAIFLVAVIARQLRVVVRVLRHGPPDPSHAGEEG